MPRRINLAALAVTLAGATQLAGPKPLSATMAPRLFQIEYCCEARTMGGVPVRCCGTNWCAVTPSGCANG